MRLLGAVKIMSDVFNWSNKMSREQIVEKVKQFYKENKIEKTATVSQEQVMSRLVLFTEWLQNQKSETETWADIFDAQPD